MRIRYSILPLLLLAVGCDKGKKAPPAGREAPRPAPPSPPTPAPAPADLKQPPADATKTADGLVSMVLRPGTGVDHPGPNDVVFASVDGWGLDGKLFDSTQMGAGGDAIALRQAIEGLRKGIPLMVVGEKRRFWIPAELGPRGDRGKPDGPVVYDVELRDFRHAPPGPSEADLAGPPKGAKKTPMGVAYVFLHRAGAGARRVRITDNVVVHFSGWTKDGRMYDSSVERNSPLTMSAVGINKGFQNGLLLMSVGDKLRIWAPSNLCFSDHPPRQGDPAGPLIYDIELISIR